MKCHYCEEQIDTGTQKYANMKNQRTEEVIYLHWPNCKVRFGIFHKTKKELVELGILK